MSAEACCYCGRTGDTRDHIPPVTLFSKPRPNNLITVPACSVCNKSFMKDDEYFRLAITTGIDKQFPRELSDSIKAINNLIRPASLGFAEKLLTDYDPTIPDRMLYDKKRVLGVVDRITRGLFYHHYQQRVPDEWAVRSNLLMSSDQREQIIDLNVEDRAAMDGLSAQMIEIGPGVFSYMAISLEASNLPGAMWLLRFYRHRTFLCVTAPEPAITSLT